LNVIPLENETDKTLLPPSDYSHYRESIMPIESLDFGDLGTDNFGADEYCKRIAFDFGRKEANEKNNNKYLSNLILSLYI